MFDQVQLGWLDNDDYRRAAEQAGVVEVPDGPPQDVPPPAEPPEPPEPAVRVDPEPTLLGLPREVACGRWDDPNPPGLGR